MTLRIAFVCSGNICRSPMAAAFARHKLAARERSAVVVSAGTLGIVGHRAAEHAQTAMDEVGISVRDHYSQGVQPAIMGAADHIVVMSPRHEAWFQERLRPVAHKVVRMWEFADTPLTQIDDPVGQDLAAFQRCRDLLDTCVERWLDSLEE